MWDCTFFIRASSRSLSQPHLGFGGGRRAFARDAGVAAFDSGRRRRCAQRGMSSMVNSSGTSIHVEQDALASGCGWNSLRRSFASFV